MSEDDIINVHVKTVDGSKFFILANLDDTLLELKKKIENKASYKVDKQVITYKGEPLKDNYITLRDANFNDLSTIHLLSRVIGGYKKPDLDLRSPIKPS
ncbi:unnamed protein product [Moneuplotes crassus]|uniref:Ubiquitin-like domain-containing protein n=1 Tax=Euplotes crassus TaxID=5936 RepID=A0AAD1Y7H9_EUPCR|nr:unnamed protein product [Moneuplotes crassus]